MHLCSLKNGKFVLIADIVVDAESNLYARNGVVLQGCGDDWSASRMVFAKSCPDDELQSRTKFLNFKSIYSKQNAIKTEVPNSRKQNKVIV